MEVREVDGAAFAAEAVRLADRLGDPRLHRIAAGLTAPPAVAVTGRAGVGRRSVAAALAGAGLAPVAPAAAEAGVYVLAEAAKPEDRAVVAATAPDLIVLNRADLPGGATPAAVADRLGTAVRPLSARLALAGQAAGDADLRRRSGIDPVVRRLSAVALHRRLTVALTRLAALAVEEEAVAELCTGAAAVAARFAAATDLAETLAGGGFPVGPADGPDAALRAAIGWQRRRRAPLNAGVRVCAADLTVGLLRRWHR